MAHPSHTAERTPHSRTAESEDPDVDRPAQDASARRWYVFRTLPRAEAVAEANLVRQGFEVFLPRIREMRRHARRREIATVPLFPRYGFVRLDPGRERWRSINGTVGVASLIMARDIPRVVAEGVVEDLLDLVGPEGTIDSSHGFRAGDSVRLRAGPLTGQIGVLVHLDGKGRVDMLLSLIAGQVRVRVARDMLESVCPSP